MHLHSSTKQFSPSPTQAPMQDYHDHDRLQQKQDQNHPPSPKASSD